MSFTIRRRHAILIGAALAALPSACLGQDDTTPASEEFGKRARLVLDTLTQGREQVNEVGAATGGRWMKVREKSSSGTFDVRRTDSMVDPVLATIEVTILVEFTRLWPTEAEAASAPFTRADEYRLIGAYNASAGGQDWAFKSGRVWTKSLGDWVDVPAQDMHRMAARRNIPQSWFWEFIPK